MRLALLLLLALASPVFAIPQLLSLDGYLTNSTGSALNGSYSFVFSLYNTASGGSALWTETQTLAVSSGKLNALLGSVTALNLAFDQDYYLGVKVSTDNEMAPRYRIASSAYAYTANTAKFLAQNATALGGLKFGDTASACDLSSRGTMKYVAGGSGVADGVYQCMKKTSGNYSWTLIKGGAVSATGGTVTEVDGYRIHTFTSTGTFTVLEGGAVDVLVVAGGGAGGGRAGGGGGGGGFIYTADYPVDAPQAISVTVGLGGTAGAPDTYASSGGNSIFGSITAIGGGGSAGGNVFAGSAGGSGGAGSYGGAGGAGTAGQGYAGGGSADAPYYNNGGGGGAGGPGQAGTSSHIGSGGPGLPSNISGTLKYYAGGGGGGGHAPNPDQGYGGIGGGGDGGGYTVWANGVAGTPNTGGGGGGATSQAGGSNTGGAGGSGIVIVRYRL